MNARIKKSILFLIFTLSLPFCLSAQTNNPPDNGTIGTVINTGSVAQVKNGDLSVNAFSAVLNSYFASKVGIGTASILATLDVNPTITAATDLRNIKSGLVYNGGSTMANYYGTYIAAPTGSGTITNKYALVTEPNAGKVGIGTVAPASALSVNGSIQMSDDTSACTTAKAGAVRWSVFKLQVCNGTTWVDTRTLGVTPAASCPIGSLCGLIYYQLSTSYVYPSAQNFVPESVSVTCISQTGTGVCLGLPNGGWTRYQTNAGPAPTSGLTSCGAGYTYEEISRQYLQGTGGISKYEAILGACRKLDPAFCSASGPCPQGLAGATCTSNSVASSETCPANIVSTCANGAWSPTPAAYLNCSVPPSYGCTDSDACNYDSDANTNNNTCYYRGDSCENSNECNSSNGTYDSNCSCDAGEPDPCP